MIAPHCSMLVGMFSCTGSCSGFTDTTAGTQMVSVRMGWMFHPGSGNATLSTQTWETIRPGCIEGFLMFTAMTSLQLHREVSSHW